MMNVMPIMAGGATGQFPDYSSTPESPEEREKRLAWETWKQKRQLKKDAWNKEPLTIDKLTPYSLSQVTQSLNRFLYGGNSKKEGNAWSTGMGARYSQQGMDYNNNMGSREEYKQGSSYGVEDEFRYLTDNGWEGERRKFGGGGFGMGIDDEEEALPPGKKPGDEGYSYEPTNNYTGAPGTPLGFTDQDRADLAKKLGSQGQAKPDYSAEYAKYDPQAVANIARSGQVTTGFYNKAYGQSPEMGQKMFGHADLDGNLAAGITATQLKNFFDNGGMGTLNVDQQMGTGGIYDQIAAAAEAEEPVELESLPAPKPPGQMNIGPSMVGNSGNASGVRAKRSNSSRAGRNTRGTSQFNRNSFGNRKTSSLTIGGLNI